MYFDRPWNITSAINNSVKVFDEFQQKNIFQNLICMEAMGGIYHGML